MLGDVHLGERTSDATYVGGTYQKNVLQPPVQTATEIKPQINPLISPRAIPILKKVTLSGRFAHFFVVMSMGVEWDRIRRLIEEVVEGQGYELVDAEIRGAGENSVLRIFIDKLSGISHHDCELVS